MDQADEIDLRELFATLWRGRWLIAGVTAVSIVVAAVFSFFVLPPVYEARAIIVVTALSKSERSGEGEGSLVDGVVRRFLPGMSLETYRQQVVNPVVLTRVRERLGLKDSVGQLAGSVKARSLKDTNLIEVIAQYGNPEAAASISNAVAVAFEEYLSDSRQQQIRMASNLVELQLAAEEKRLGEAVDEYACFLRESRPISEIKDEMEAKTALVTEYRSELVKVEIEAQATEAFIERCTADLELQPRVLTVTRSILDDSLMRDSAMERSGSSMSSLAGLRVTSEEINQVHLDLASDLAMRRATLAELTARKAAISRAIGDLDRSLGALRLEYAEREIEDRRLATKVETLRRVYLGFLQEYEEAKIGETMELGQASISLAVPAEPPAKAISPRKMLNVAVAAVLGAMVSIFVAWFIFQDRADPVPRGMAGD